MQHRPFPKIPTTLAPSSGAGGSWIATEKIHGAQLLLASDGDTVRFGKRKAWLAPDEPFFGWQLLRNELELAVPRPRAARRRSERGRAALGRDHDQSNADCQRAV